MGIFFYDSRGEFSYEPSAPSAIYLYLYTILFISIYNNNKFNMKDLCGGCQFYPPQTLRNPPQAR